MSASKGFGKLIKIKNKEQISLRQLLRQIHGLAKKKHRAVLQEHEIVVPDGFETKHWAEWVKGSAVDPETVKLNVKSLSGGSSYAHLLYSPKLSRTNTGRLSLALLKAYHHLDNGGWWCSGIDVLSWQDALWGCFKPNTPKTDLDRNKLRKYEHPPTVPTEIFALRVPSRIWQLVSHRYSAPLPENYEKAGYSEFWKWVLDNNLPVIICEGVKKAASILSCGYIAIALPGVWSGIRQPRDEDGQPIGAASLIPQLRVFATPGRRIYLCFDSDTKRQTSRSVNKALSKTGKLLLTQKCEVNIISWHQVLGKGVDDVIAVRGREQFDDFYRNALTFDEWQSHQLRRLTYTPDVVLNQRYIGEIVPPESAQLIGIKAPKGTGKTEWFKFLCDPVLRSAERRVLFITHRIQLSFQGADRIGIPYITQTKDTGEGALLGYGLCIDSLHPQSQAHFKPEEWRGAWVIVDEIQQVLWHLLSSSTCKKDRVIIIKTLQQLLRTVVATGGKIFIADADLNDVAIDFIEGLLGFSPERFLLVNEYKFTDPWTIYRFGGSTPAALIAALERKLKNGEKALLCCSGQKAKSTWGAQVVEEYFRRKYPHLRILRIDSETVANPEHPAFRCTRDLNEVVTQYDLVIASPTIETGVSIDVRHFDGVWGIFQGVQTCDGVRQHLSRERSPAPRYVWAKAQGINFFGNKATSPAGLIFSQRQLDETHRKKLADAALIEMPDGNFSPICLETWAKLGAIINTGMWKHEQQIFADLEEEGHIIATWEDSQDELAETEEAQKEVISSEKVKEEVKAIRNEVYTKYREDVAASDKLSDTEFEKLSKQQERKTAELFLLRKGVIERKYGVDCTADLVKKDDDKWGTKLRLHYLWKPGREYLAFQDVQLVEKAIANGGGDYFIIDTNKSLMQLKVAFLDYLGIERLYESHGFHNDHPVIIDIFEKIKKNVYHIKTVVGLDLSKQVKDQQKRLKTVQDILALLGHKIVCYKYTGKRKQQIRYYSSPAAEFHKNEETKKLILGGDGLPIPLPDGREAVFDAWLQRDAEARRKVEEEALVAA
ncbi:MAG: plasmid replication protein, CyRepA1 family, partial [Brasilonema sp.]